METISPSIFWTQKQRLDIQNDECLSGKTLPEQMPSALPQTFPRNDNDGLQNYLLPFSGEDTTSFPYWWWISTQTLEKLNICPSMQKELLLKAIIDPARSSILTITESSGTLSELWEELNLKFGDSLIAVQN